MSSYVAYTYVLDRNIIKFTSNGIRIKSWTNQLYERSENQFLLHMLKDEIIPKFAPRIH